MWSVMVLFRVKRIFIFCAIFCAGCDFPPEEAASIREQLQAQISKGQVYIIHSSKELSYVIKNSEFTMRPEKEKEKLVSSVEKEMLEVLSKYRNYKYVRIYFLGDGTRGIDKPYICQLTIKACIKIKEQNEPDNRIQSDKPDATRALFCCCGALEGRLI
jgi:hypothetical protein